MQRLVVAALWIFGSPHIPLVDRPWLFSACSARVDAQSVQSLSSASEDDIASCDGNQQPRPAAIYSSVGHLNYGVGLDLKPDISIPGACEVNLPIDVPTRELGIDAAVPFRVVEVTSSEPDGNYGVGSEITVDVRFSSTVFVEGTPTLRLRTGCHDSSCTIPEVQSFVCRASRGEFAITFNGETLPNIDAGTSEEGLKRVLQDFSGIEQATVEYSASASSNIDSASLPLGSRGVCSDNGTTVTVTFQSISIEGDDGDLPLLELDYLNSPVNRFTGRSWGDHHRLWYGWLNEEEEEPERAEKDISFGGYFLDNDGKVILGDDGLNGLELGPAVEETRGWKPADRMAVYTGGSGSNTLSFLYVVREGDSSQDLDYYDEFSIALPGNASIVGDNDIHANLKLPPIGYAAVYRLGTGASLGANKAIVIDTSPPFVVQVNSPNEARVYGTGEVIFIDVVFSHYVTLYGKPTLTLETGLFNQEVPLLSSSNETLTFKYEIQEGDSAADLDYASSTALSLNGGAIYRSSDDATMEALLTLPVPGETGSLSHTKDIVVRSTTANIIDVDSNTADGEYGAGEEIFINVTFGWWDDDITPMTLVGDSAVLLLRVGWRVRAAVHGAVSGSTQLVLEEGHDLTVEDIGETISVGTSELTLLNITGNEAEISEPYIGDDILEGSPMVNVSSSGYEPATYYSGNGTAHFIFLYTVQPGDHANDLEYWSKDAFKTDGFIRRASDEEASAVNISLPEPRTCKVFRGCSLGANRDLMVSTVMPSVENITTTKPSGRGPYGVGDEIDVTVRFTKPVEVLANVTKAPRLRMDTGNFAEYFSGSGSKVITFIYTVQEGDNTQALDTWDAPANGELSALDVRYAGNFGYLRRTSTWPTTDADLTLPIPGSSGSLSGDVLYPIVLDTNVAKIVAVNSSIENGTYGVGEEILLHVTFTSAVRVNRTSLTGGLPSFILNSGGSAFYDGGNGTSVLEFLYTVQEGDSSDGLDIDAVANDVTATSVVALPVEGTIYDAVLELPAVVTLPKQGTTGSLETQSNITIDTEPPVVAEVFSTLSDGLYGPGHEVEILIRYTAPVVAYGAPRLWLDLGEVDGYAEFQALSGGTNDTLLFVYIIQEGDSTVDLDYTSPFALELPYDNTTASGAATSVTNSSVILRASTNPSQNASVVLPTNGRPGSLGASGNIWIETTPPSIERVSTSAADGVARGIAGRSQTIDVYGSPGSIASGGFRLTYSNDNGIGSGGSSSGTIYTDCIPANSSLLTVDTVAGALTSANGFLNVTVAEDDSPFTSARRFVVDFDMPTLGVGTLRVADADDECEWLQCVEEDDHDDDGVGDCHESGVIVNRDASVAVQEGAIEVVLHFAAPVVVNATQGSPVLLLRMDPTNTTTLLDDGVRYAEHVPGLTQVVDIGVDALSPVSRGHFRLAYGGAISGCIDVNSAESAAGGFSMKSRLEELEEIKLLGVEEVTREARGNGFRFTIVFRAGNPGAVGIPSAENITEGCLVEFDPPLEPTDFSVPVTEWLSFLYVLQPGDMSDGVEIAGADALVLNGSTIKRASTFPSQEANITFYSGSTDSPSSSSGGGSGGTSGLYGFSLRGGGGGEYAGSTDFLPVVVDCSDAPVVLDLTATAFAGEYGAGQRIYFQALFSSNVIVDEGGSAQLLLETGAEDRPATFYTGNGTSVLTFRSTVQEGDSAASLGPYSRTALTSNGGFVRSASYQASVDAKLRLPSRFDNYSADGGAIVVDTSVPQVVSLYTLKEDGVYGEGEEVAFFVLYTHAMDVLGTPTVPLDSGGEASFTLGGRKQIVSVAGDDDADFAFGVAHVTAGSFRLQYQDEITECIGFNSSEDAILALRELKAFANGGLDNVTVSALRGGYIFEVYFSVGDAAFERYPSALEVPWNYYEGCEAFSPANAKPARVTLDTLVFLYEVGGSDSSLRLDVENDTSIVVDGLSSYIRRHQSSSITDGNTSLPNEPLRKNGSNIVVNTTHPIVTGVYGVNGNGPFRYNEEVEIRVDFSLPVTVLDAEETASDGNTATVGSDELPLLSLVVGSTSTAKTTTYLTAAAVYTTWSLLSFAAVANLPSVYDDGGYNYSSSAFFKYLVGADDDSVDLRYLSSSSLVGSIRRLSSNPLAAADLSLPGPGSNGSLSYNSDIVIDAASQETAAHNVTRSPSVGTLGIGDEVIFSVHFTRKVRFTGATPTLELATASPFDVVPCSSPEAGSYADALNFTYVVSPGDRSSDLSYTDTKALSIAINANNDSSSMGITAEIVDESGNAVNLTIPPVGSDFSVTGGEEWEELEAVEVGGGALVVDTSNVIQYVTALNGDGVYYVGESIFIQVVYNNDVVVFGTPLLTLRVGDAPYYNRKAVYVSGSATSALVFEYIVELGDHTIHLDYDGTNALFLPTATEASSPEDGIVSAVRSKYDETIDADPTLPPVWSPDTLGARVAITVAGDVTPTVVSISCPLTPGGGASYGVGEEIDLEVLFTTRIFVKNSLTLPYLLVETGEERRGEAQAIYLRGNLTDTLTFRYIVVEGDSTDKFDILDTRTAKRQKFSTALVRPPAAEVKAASDRPTVDALLFLAVPGEAGTISFAKNITLDTEAPYIRSVSVSSGDGVYGTGDKIELVCLFSQPVVVVGEDSGTPSIGLSLGRIDKSARAVYSGGNGTTEFLLSYTVQHGDHTELLDYESADSFLLFQTWQQALERSGVAIKRVSTNPSQDADLTLAPPGSPLTVLGKFSISATGSKVAVQTDNVRAIGATSSFSNGTYPEGSVIPVTIMFSVEVYVMHGVPSLSLNVGDAGSNETTINTSTASGATTDNTTAASAVTGYANYTSGNGTSEIYLAYTVQAGDFSDRLDYSSPGSSALTAPFGAIMAKDTLEPVYLRSLPEPGTQGSLGWNKDIKISDEVLLVERVWTTSPEGSYGTGEEIELLVGFRFPVLVESETAFLSINVVAGGYEVELSRQDTVTNALVFTYTVQEGHETAALEIASPDALNGTMRLNATYATSPINVTLPAAGESESLSYDRTIEIETAAPFVVSAVSTQPNGTYTARAVIGITVTFSLPVVIVNGGFSTNCTDHESTTSPTGSGNVACEGMPMLLLDASGEYGDKNATYASGNGTADLLFEYQVQDGDGSSRLDYTSTTALSAGAWDILRASTNPSTPVDLELPAKGAVGSLGWSSEITVDSSAGYILDINSSKADGVYGIGEAIFIDVYMSTPMNVKGTPYLELNAGIDAVALYASGGSVDGVLTFLYTVSEGDSTLDLDTGGENALVVPEGSTIQSVADERSPMIIVLNAHDEGPLRMHKDLVIDTQPPHVLLVASSKGNEKYGAGEEIDITVTFNYPVVVVDGAVLLIDTGEATVLSEAVFISGNGSATVTFLYTVSEGDKSADLGTFEGGGTGEGGGLVGILLRSSDNPSQEANISLPVSGEDGSLTVNNDIVIDTTAPYVTAVLSLREGVYTVGETVDLQVIYNMPVNVTGIPRLVFALQEANDTVPSKSYAYYDPSFDIGSFADQHRALSFIYVVNEGDQMEHFKHDGSDALELHNNATIKRASSTPTTDALLNLPVSEGGSLVDLVAKTEVIIRGLYHADVSDLDITLLHQERSCILSSSAETLAAKNISSTTRPAGVQFGVPEERRYMNGFGPNPAASTGATSRPAFWHRGIGYDYAFADVVGENVANHEQAVSRQSSTLFAGVSGSAVDGNSAGSFSDGSTILTSLEVEPWWQVTLAKSYTLGYIRIFGREEEVVKAEVQTITLRSRSALGGSFTLNFTDAVGTSMLTDDIQYNAVGSFGEEHGNSTGAGAGESMESKLEELSIISSVEVTRSSPSASDEVYQRTWTVTFMSPEGDVPQIELGSDAGLTSYGNEFIFATIQDGAAPGGIYADGVTQSINTKHGPSWVMVFKSTEAAEGLESLEHAKASASFSVYLPDNAHEVNIPIPEGVDGRVIRIQLEGTGYLSISELQAYELTFLPLSKSTRSNPLPIREEWDPIHAEESLTAAFMDTTVSGQWVLRLRDTTAKELETGIGRSANRYAHGDGGVAGWELVVTDFFGNLFRFSTDSLVTVETLPKYGRLFATTSAAEAIAAAAITSPSTITNATTTSTTYQITNAHGFDRHLGPCRSVGGGDRGDPSRNCPDTFGVGPSLSTRSLGAVAARNKVRATARGGATFWYVPEEDYVGADDFAFSVTVGGVKSEEAWVVGVHTRRCRLFEEGEAHGLCHCKSPVIHVENIQQGLCHAAVESVCASELPGLGGNKTDSNARLNNKIKVRMCKACDVAYQGQVTSTPESFSEYTSECLAEIGKVGDWLVTEGFCQESYSFPLCDQDTFDPVGSPIESGTSLGSSRSFKLEGLGSKQTDRTDFRRRVGIGARGGEDEDEGACRCTQVPEECVCRNQAWAIRNQGN